MVCDNAGLAMAVGLTFLCRHTGESVCTGGVALGGQWWLEGAVGEEADEGEVRHSFGGHRRPPACCCAHDVRAHDVQRRRGGRCRWSCFRCWPPGTCTVSIGE